MTSTATPSQDAGTVPSLPRARVVLPDAFGGKHVVQVEVATTPESRQRGLMHRRELRAGDGMLFIFPSDAVQSFWMKNTLIPLDMLFIDRERRVVGIVHRAEPLTLTPRSVGRVSRYVLEVPGGWSEERSIRVGSQVELEGVGGLPIH
ncbi:MAG: DUF192 domain-containing protein [Myxococcaceae bacterium]|nr:DUF192 domain-containing protein [Myxococcaceae bacterium]MCI0673880.1 DUF192 domain-containing protein [Myxococcaceae bacterium]